MNFQSHYSSIKIICDLSLFGIESPEKYLSANENVAFSKEFLSYQNRFILLKASETNEILLQTCLHYLPKLEKQARRDLVKVLLENKPVTDALMILTRLDLGLGDPEQYSAIFHSELNEYIEKNKIHTSLLLFRACEEFCVNGQPY